MRLRGLYCCARPRACFLAADLPSGSRRALVQTGQEQPKQGSADAHFVGSQRCVGCHAREHAGTGALPSTRPPWRKRPRRRFWETSMVRTSATMASTATSSNGTASSAVRTDGPDGRRRTSRSATRSASSRLQQYLIELPGGRLQALGIAWDTRPRRTAANAGIISIRSQARGRAILLHWTGIEQNWNYQCAYYATRPTCRRTTTLRQGNSKPPGPRSASAARPATDPPLIILRGRHSRQARCSVTANRKALRCAWTSARA